MSYIQRKEEAMLLALWASVEHWADNYERACTGRDLLLGSANCPLCTTYKGEECNGCPIKEDTGQSGCLKTPYYDVEAVFIAYGSEGTDLREAVLKMYQFVLDLTLKMGDQMKSIDKPM